MPKVLNKRIDKMGQDGTREEVLEKIIDELFSLAFVVAKGGSKGKDARKRQTEIIDILAKKSRIIGLLPRNDG